MKKNKETVLWTLKHAVFFGTMEMFYNGIFLGPFFEKDQI